MWAARNFASLASVADEADENAWNRAKRPKKCLLATNRNLRAVVAEKLQAQCSPQQISGWLKTQFPKNPELQFSHEAIYQTLYVQGNRLFQAVSLS